MKRISFFAQVTGLLLLVLVVPSAIVTSYNLYTTLAYAEEEIAETAIDQMESVSATNEMVLFNIVKNALRLVQSGTFKQIRGMTSYAELNDGYENISKAMALQNLFDDLLLNETAIHSAYFILEDSDYVVSSDRGISKIDEYRTQIWLEDVLKDLNSLEGTWVFRNMPEATMQQSSTSKETIPVFSYVYTLKTIASSIKGTVVVNVYENNVSSYLNPNADDGTTETILVDKNGLIVAARNNELLQKSIKNAPYYNSLNESDGKQGYAYYTQNGERFLMVYRQSDLADWTYISTNSVTSLMKNVRHNYYKSIFLIGMTILVGGTMIFYLMSRTLKPVQELAKAVQEEQNGGNKERNELKIIARAFSNLKEKETALSSMLEHTEGNTIRLALRDSLRGDNIAESARAMVKEVIPYDHIMVAYVGVDHQQAYYKRLNEEERKYYRYQVNSIIEEILEEKEVTGKAVRYVANISAVILSFRVYDRRTTNKQIIDIFQLAQERIFKTLHCTVTIGISSIHSGDQSMAECAREADTAYQHKLSLGTNRIISWKEYMLNEDQFYYPYTSEERLLNLIKLREPEGIKAELSSIRDHIVNHSDLSIDNILFIYNQLAGTILRYLVENQINTYPIFGEYGFIYEKIATMETVQEIEDALYYFAVGVINHLKNMETGSEQDYHQQIIGYIESNYAKNIDFEEMAATIGISYSYMRKIIKRTMNKSLLDCLNNVRIDKAKAYMINQPNLCLGDIATKVGYTNTQSLTRYFKKYEGISPSQYKGLHVDPNKNQ